MRCQSSSSAWLGPIQRQRARGLQSLRAQRDRLPAGQDHFRGVRNEAGKGQVAVNIGDLLPTSFGNGGDGGRPLRAQVFKPVLAVPDKLREGRIGDLVLPLTSP